MAPMVIDHNDTDHIHMIYMAQKRLMFNVARKYCDMGCQQGNKVFSLA